MSERRRALGGTRALNLVNPQVPRYGENPDWEN